LYQPRVERPAASLLTAVSLVAIAKEFSPRYQRHGDDLVSIDVRGLERLLGPPRTIAHELRREAADRGARVHVAIAGTQTAALVLALARPGITVVEPGDEAAALAAIPIGIFERIFPESNVGGDERRRPVLDTREHYGASAAGVEVRPAANAEAESLRSRPRHGESGSGVGVGPHASKNWPTAIAALKHWGLRTLGELAALPAADLVARRGCEARVLQAIARGEDLGPLVPDAPEERFESSLELEWPIEELEPLSFVLTRLLEPLSIRLERRDRGAAVLHVELQLVTQERHACRLELPTPMREVRALRTLAMLDLESHPPSAAVDRVTVVIDPTPGRVLQHTLFTRAHPTPEQMSTLLARLGALMGQDRIGAPAMVDSYRPGAFAMTPFASDCGYAAGARAGGAANRHGEGASPFHSARGAPPPRAEDLAFERRVSRSGEDCGNALASALRRCRQPVPARVAVADGRPIRVTTDRRSFAGGTVLACAGPWRTSGNWWNAFDCEGAPGTGERPIPSPAAESPRARPRGSEVASGVGIGPLPSPAAESLRARPRASEVARGVEVGPLTVPEAESLRARPRDSEAVPGVGVGPHAIKQWSRDEWDVSLSDGAVYRIFRDRESDAWFIDAIVD
jgi:hypothetical protein